MIPDLAVGVKAYLIYFVFHCEFEVVFAWVVKKSSRFRGFWNCDLQTNLFNGLLWTSLPFVQKATCVRLSKENLFCSNNVPKIHIFNSWWDQKLLFLANQLQDSTFLFEINSKNIGICKLASHLKLLPSLLQFCEMRNALQLPVFFFLFSLLSFFCQLYLEYWGIQSKKIFYRPSKSWYNSVIMFI